MVTKRKTAFDWSRCITIMLAAAEGHGAALLFLMVLAGLRMVVNGLMIDELVKNTKGNEFGPAIFIP